MTPDLGRQRDRTRDDNDAVVLLLGALAELDRFAAVAQAPGPPGDADDALTSAALGLISLRRSLRRWALHAACESSKPTRAQSPSQRAGVLR